MNTLPTFKDPEITKDQAVAVVGSKARLARVLRVSRSTVTEWNRLPVHQAYRLVQMYPELANLANQSPE